jgi:hypothetical protein
MSPFFFARAMMNAGGKDTWLNLLRVRVLKNN